MFWLFQKKVYLKSHKLMIRKGKELSYQGRKVKILSIKNDYVKIKNYVKSGCSISLIPLETFIEDVDQDTDNKIAGNFTVNHVRKLYVCK